MQISALQLSQLLGGEVEGDPGSVVTSFGKIEEAEPGMLCFLGNPKYESYAYSTRATILLVGKDFKPRQPVHSTLVKVDNVYSAVAALTEKFSAQEERPQGISERASVHPDAKIGNDVYIGDFAVVDKNAVISEGAAVYPQAHIAAGCRIGAHTKIYSGVKIYKNVQIGDHCVIQANAVIGSDGFGFAPQADGTYHKIQHLGSVILENNVEVGANTTIDRASMGSTIIRQGVKLDNLIQIAHNVEIGENTVIAAGTAIAGSTKIGKNCRIGGQVGIAGHLHIADGTHIQAQSGLNFNTKPSDKLFGSPAFNYMRFLRSYGVFKTLPDLAKRIAALEHKLPPADTQAPETDDKN